MRGSGRDRKGGREGGKGWVGMADPVINPVGLKPACQAGTAVPFHFITGMRRERERGGGGGGQV